MDYLRLKLMMKEFKQRASIFCLIIISEKRDGEGDAGLDHSVRV